jgi:hypothetical protein
MDRIRQIVVGVVVVGLLSLAAYAQSKGRDFSGTWVLDTGRSGSLAQNNDLPKATIVITGLDDQLQITSTRGPINESVRYAFGSIETLQTQLLKVQGGSTGAGLILKWEGDDLFTALPTRINDTAVTIVEHRRMSRDGKEMTVETRVDVQHGYQGSTSNSSPPVSDVYVKKAP